MSSVTRVVGQVAAIAGTLLLATTSVQAGGFSIREQSASGLGRAFAGVAAGGDLSSIYWNPAALSEVPGTSIESHASFLYIDTEHTARSATSFSPLVGGSPAPPTPTSVDLLGLGFSGTSGNIGGPAFVPASYGGRQMTSLNPNLFIGVGINAPLGLVTEPEDFDYVGSEIARTARVFTLNFNPVIA
ncbi:MAG: OmpP1/FadL family transporter, partial [Methyloligellaceae bacterium]